MTLGIAFVMLWFAAIAAYLVWQYATNALAVHEDSSARVAPVMVARAEYQETRTAAGSMRAWAAR